MSHIEPDEVQLAWRRQPARAGSVVGRHVAQISIGRNNVDICPIECRVRMRWASSVEGLMRAPGHKERDRSALRPPVRSPGALALKCLRSMPQRSPAVLT